MEAAGSIGLSAWLYGAEGHDRLKGGAGHDVLLGETGDDLVVGGSGRDFLVGGIGADRIVGNADDDILVAGSLQFPDRDTAIGDIMAEWTSTERDYATRVANLTNQGNGDRANGLTFLIAVDESSTLADERTVIEDTDKDVLTGSAGLDWFFLHETEDKATDLSDEAFANDLNWITA